MSERYFIINIGRNVNDTPMSEERWHFFQQDIRHTASQYGTLVADGTYFGHWGDIEEMSYTVHLITHHTNETLTKLREELSILETIFRQDAIALVESTNNAIIHAA